MTRTGGRRVGALVLGLAVLLAVPACAQDDPAPAGTAEEVAEESDGTQDRPETGESTALPVEERPFAADSPWNTRIDAARVHPDSDELMSLARLRTGIDERGERTTEEIDAGLYINTESWTLPVVTGGEPTEVVCRQRRCGDGDDTVVLDVPADVDPDPRYDGWFTVLDVEEHRGYDLWRARREEDGSISYHYMRTWDLDGPGYGKAYQPGARGSGLPLFAGLVRPGELQNGLIEHALAISVPGPATGSFVRPASTTDGNGELDSLPEGARIRLKADAVPEDPVDPVTGRPIRLTRAQQRMADAIASTLRTYGAIVVDRAAVPTLYAQRDVTADLLDGNELQGLRLEDFEVIRFSASDRFDYPEKDAADRGPSGDEGEV